MWVQTSATFLLSRPMPMYLLKHAFREMVAHFASLCKSACRSAGSADFLDSEGTGAIERARNTPETANCASLSFQCGELTRIMALRRCL